MRKKLINLMHIAKSYGDNVILDDLNLYIRENEFITCLLYTSRSADRLIRL